MDPVDDNTSFARGGHAHRAENNSAAYAVCPGPGSRASNIGTVLSDARADRTRRGALGHKG
jgi:hypothetical protein